MDCDRLAPTTTKPSIAANTLIGRSQLRLSNGILQGVNAEIRFMTELTRSVIACLGIRQRYLYRER